MLFSLFVNHSGDPIPRKGGASSSVGPRTAYVGRMCLESRIAIDVPRARTAQHCRCWSLPSVESAHLNLRRTTVGTSLVSYPLIHLGRPEADSMKSQSGDVRILRILTPASENGHCAKIGVPPHDLPAGKSELSQSKPDLLFNDLREVGPPGRIFQSVPHHSGGEEAVHFL